MIVCDDLRHPEIVCSTIVLSRFARFALICTVVIFAVPTFKDDIDTNLRHPYEEWLQKLIPNLIVELRIFLPS